MTASIRGRALGGGHRAADVWISRCLGAGDRGRSGRTVRIDISGAAGDRDGCGSRGEEDEGSFHRIGLAEAKQP